MTDQAKGRMGDDAMASAIMANIVRGKARVRGVWRVVCRGADGAVKWVEEMENIIVNAGLTYLIGVALLTTTQIALSSWFCGLTTGTPTFAAADTMASHAGWTEYQGYSQGARVAWAGVAGAAGAASNTASPASYTISGGGGTVGGVFLTSNSTKGGTTGTLFSGVAFTGGNRTVADNDTLNVTYNLSCADDGV